MCEQRRICTQTDRQTDRQTDALVAKLHALTRGDVKCDAQMKLTIKILANKCPE